MQKIRFISLFSGSAGNCTAVCCGDDTILIDAGRSAKAIVDGLAAQGIDAASVRAIFITHEHTDHISALRVFLKKHPIPVYSAAETYSSLLPACGDMAVRRPRIFQERIGHMTVRSFPTSHDAASPVGYRVDIDTYYADGGETRGGLSLGIATDTGRITPEMQEALDGCCAVLLESNHDTEMLRRGPYPPELQRRIASEYGHLSNERSAALAAELARSGTRGFILAHISDENNTRELAASTCRRQLDGAGFGEEVAVIASCRATAVEITSLSELAATCETMTHKGQCKPHGEDGQTKL